jgi:hypothetical protein
MKSTVINFRRILLGLIVGIFFSVWVIGSIGSHFPSPMPPAEPGNQCVLSDSTVGSYYFTNFNFIYCTWSCTDGTKKCYSYKTKYVPN